MSTTALKRKIGLSKDLRVVKQQFFGAASAKRTKIGNEEVPLLIGVNHNAAVQTGSYIAGNTQERLSEHPIPLKSNAHFPFPMSSQTGTFRIKHQTLLQLCPILEANLVNMWQPSTEI